MEYNVLIIMVDSLRADRCFGVERQCHTPVLDELCRHSTVFTKTFSTASMTTCCTASLLTGAYPFVHGVRSLADYRLRSDTPTIASTFKNHGYHTWAEVTGPLVPATNLNRGFNEYHHREYTQWLDTSWGDYLRTKVQGGRSNPWMGFLHLWEIHYPRRVTPSYNRTEYGPNLYERAVSSLDYQLGLLLDALPKNTIVVLTGDHGEYLSQSQKGELLAGLKGPTAWLKRSVPGVKKWKRRITSRVVKMLDRMGRRDSEYLRGWLGHGFHVYDSLTHVPLIFYGPGIFPAATIIEEVTSHVDIFPTLVTALQLKQADTSFMSGTDLTPAIYGDSSSFQERAIYVEASGARMMAQPETWLVGIRTERFKYVRGYLNEALPEELYDLRSDPDEQVNLVNQYPDVAETMRSQLMSLMQSAPQLQEDKAVTYSSEEQQQLQQHLRSLGYLD